MFGIQVGSVSVVQSFQRCINPLLFNSGEIPVLQEVLSCQSIRVFVGVMLYVGMREAEFRLQLFRYLRLPHGSGAVSRRWVLNFDLIRRRSGFASCGLFQCANLVSSFSVGIVHFIICSFGWIIKKSRMLPAPADLTSVDRILRRIPNSSINNGWN